MESAGESGIPVELEFWEITEEADCGVIEPKESSNCDKIGSGVELVLGGISESSNCERIGSESASRSIGVEISVWWGGCWEKTAEIGERVKGEEVVEEEWTVGVCLPLQALWR